VSGIAEVAKETFSFRNERIKDGRAFSGAPERVKTLALLKFEGQKG
jgi:hypothetical protein